MLRRFQERGHLDRPDQAAAARRAWIKNIEAAFAPRRPQR
jgi:hypothetical protein